MKSLSQICLLSALVLYTITGFVAGEHLLSADRRDSPIWRSVATIAWPVLFVTATSIEIRKTKEPAGVVCCKTWQGNV